MFKVNNNSALNRSNYYNGDGVVSITGNLGSEKIDVGIDGTTVKNTNSKLNMPYTVSQPLTKNDSMQIGLIVDDNTLKINSKGELSATQGVVQGDGGAVTIVDGKVSLNADGKTIV